MGVTVDTTSDDTSPEARKKAEEVTFFRNELAAARKREEDFRKEGKRILEIYEGSKKNPFAILYSNTETLLPALYSAVPRPVVQRRFKDEDPLGKFAATTGQRSLEFLLDTNVDGYETFDDAVRAAVLAALLPGRGVTTVKYEHETQEVVPDGAAEGTAPVPVKNWETVCTDSKPWDRFLHGYAKKWSKVPWIAYEMHLDKAEAEKAGIEAAVLGKLQFTKGDDVEEDKDGQKTPDAEKNIGERETALFYQIWDREGGRKIRYLCPQYKEDFCAVLDDPLGLTGFFNCPKPIRFVERVDDQTPIPLYALYEQQAEEVNNLTIRISALIKQIKARGAYDTELGDDLKKILDADEGDLIPADKSSSLAAEKGLSNAIWMWPVEQLIVVLKELYMAREQAKRVIYEITGISDIIRGSTVASETATAQEIKSQWGTLRLKRLQKEVQRFARDLLRMILEVAAKKFSERTFAQMTGLPFATAEQKARAQSIAAAAQAAGQPPEPQTQAVLAAPLWEEVLALLRNDMQRSYRIDIESNSTVEPEATEDQKMIAEVMNALAQYLNGVAPLVQSGSLPMEAAQAMMLAIVRRFRFGPEIEDYVKAMKQPKPPDDGKAAAAAEAQMKSKAESEKLAAAQQSENAAHMREQQAEANRVALENTKLANERAADERRVAAEAAEDAAKRQAERQMNLDKLSAQRQIEQLKATSTQDTELKKAALAGAVQIEVAKITSAQKAQQADGEQRAEQATQQAATESSEKLMANVMETQAKLLQAISAPRELKVVRGGDGKVKGGRSEVAA